MREIKEMKAWVHWQYAMVNGKKTKKPFAAKGGPTGTNEKFRDTLVTYAEAADAVKERKADGVGFVLPEGYFFLDIDHMGLDSPFVQMMLSRFDSYTEYSVSGGGIHIYGKCELKQLPIFIDQNGQPRLDRQYYIKNPGNGLELYIGGLTNRFAVYTGNVIEEKTLRECTSAILTTLDKEMRKREKAETTPAKDQAREYSQIVSSLRKQKNGEKFCKLYDQGDYSNYGSQSEADAALCSLIAFRTGPDPIIIDKVFRSSALYREKWERDDYRESTINVGIQACHGNFHRSKMSHPYFIKFDESTGAAYVFAPLLAKYVREHLHYLLVRDTGKQAILIYVYETGCYRLYATEMMKGIIKSYIAEYDEELVKMGTVNEVYNQIITDLNYITQDELNVDEDLINFKNGLLHVTATETELLPHSPDVLSTIQIPCDWLGAHSPTPVFDGYMKTLTNMDKTTERLLLEWNGVCISNVKGWRMKKALFMVGPGDTGKSQLKSLTERIIGKGNFIGIDLKEIEARFGTGVVYGTRLAGSSDMSFLSVEELKTFKKITGGDSLFAEFKGQQGFEFTYNGLLWFCMNRLPKFGGDDGKWVYDRIMVVECKNEIPKDEQDKTLLDKMYAERDGIVYKAIKALQTVIANGYRFTEPESVSKARDVYMIENNTVVSFYNECMVQRPQNKICDSCSTGRVYSVYKAWCDDNNHGFAKTAKEFRDILSAHLSSSFKEITVHTNRGTFYKELTLSLEAKEHYRKAYGYDSTEFLE